MTGIPSGTAVLPRQSRQSCSSLESHRRIPQSAEASRIEVLRALWTDAGLEAVETRETTVHRTFDDFDAFWRSGLAIPPFAPTVAAMAAGFCQPSRHQG